MSANCAEASFLPSYFKHLVNDFIIKVTVEFLGLEANKTHKKPPKDPLNSLVRWHDLHSNSTINKIRNLKTKIPPFNLSQV